jgi:hypothetical protein
MRGRALNQRYGSGLVLAAVLGVAAACGEVIGIEDAAVDPRVSATGSGGQASSSGGSDSPSGGTDTGSGGDKSASGGTTVGEAGANNVAGNVGEGGAPAGSLCETYCDQILAYCSGPLEQYRDRAQCLKVCNFLPEGELAGEDNNSAACRLRYAGKARYASGTELAAYCRQAGPGGDGRCGSNCEGYCEIMMSVCTENSADVYHFEERAECLDSCSKLPASDIAYSTSDPQVSDGNHVQCRLFHVTSAAMLDTEEHCEHAVGVTLCSMESEE